MPKSIATCFQSMGLLRDDDVLDEELVRLELRFGELEDAEREALALRDADGFDGDRHEMC